jgi:hypothetical protein
MEVLWEFSEEGGCEGGEVRGVVEEKVIVSWMGGLQNVWVSITRR